MKLEELIEEIIAGNGRDLTIRDSLGLILRGSITQVTRSPKLKKQKPRRREMIQERTAMVAVLSGDFDENGIGQAKLLEVLRRVEGIIIVDRAAGPYGLPVEGPPQICFIVNPDGRELAKLRKDQIAIAVVEDLDHPYPTSLLDLGYDELTRFNFKKEIDIRRLQWLLRVINDAIEGLNWRLAIFGSEERFQLANLTD